VNVDVIPLNQSVLELLSMNEHRVYGFGNLLYWHGTMNCQMCWIPPLPPSKLILESDCLRFRNTVSGRSFPLKDLRVIRVHSKWISTFVLIGQTNGHGFRLAFVPLSPKNMMAALRQHCPEIAIDVYNTFFDKNESDDRKRFNLPDRPSG